MQQHKRANRIILGLLALGVLAGVALTANSAQAASGVGPYFPDPAWDRKLPAAFRFVVLTNWDYAAVLDKETGLVWERAPGPVPQTWSAAKMACLNKTVSNRKGWRLPSAVELMSLIDPSVTSGREPAPGPSLCGHPAPSIGRRRRMGSKSACVYGLQRRRRGRRPSIDAGWSGVCVVA